MIHLTIIFYILLFMYCAIAVIVFIFFAFTALGQIPKIGQTLLLIVFSIFAAAISAAIWPVSYLMGKKKAKELKARFG